MASNTAGNAGAQVDASTQDASLAASGGIVKMSVAPVMSNDSGLVRSTVNQANLQAAATGGGVVAGAG
ncbi:hypothetical protein GGR65_000077 [Xanthomonas sp. 3376]|nr:hypothetical protein [Xanthomonas arboricola]